MPNEDPTSDGRDMILCSCSIISDRDIKASVKPCGASADRARDVFRSNGCLPKCGRCVKNIQNLCNREVAAKVKDWSQASRRSEMVIAAE
jgi:bacterioferritin-associated ferredoxin